MPASISGISIMVPVIDLLVAKMNWHDANPDVGMGPFAFCVLDDILEEYRVTLSQEQKDEVLNEYRVRHTRR